MRPDGLYGFKPVYPESTVKIVEGPPPTRWQRFRRGVAVIWDKLVEAALIFVMCASFTAMVYMVMM